MYESSQIKAIKASVPWKFASFSQSGTRVNLNSIIKHATHGNQAIFA
jgi:hypothetical protein